MRSWIRATTLRRFARSGVLFSALLNFRCARAPTSTPTTASGAADGWGGFLLNREADKPLAGVGTAQRDGFDRAFDGAVVLKSHCSHLREREGIPLYPHPVSIFGIGEAIVATFARKSRVACWVFSRLNAAKERLEREINPYLNILQDLRMDPLQVRVGLLPLREQPVRVVQSQWFLPLFFKHLAHSCYYGLNLMRTQALRLKRLKQVKPVYPTAKAGGLYGLLL